MAEQQPLDLDEIYEFALRLGKEAGSILLTVAEKRSGGGEQQSHHLEKENAVDLVTQTDEGMCNSQLPPPLVKSKPSGIGVA